MIFLIFPKEFEKNSFLNGLALDIIYYGPFHFFEFVILKYNIYFFIHSIDQSDIIFNIKINKTFLKLKNLYEKNFENFIFILIGTTGGNEIGDIIFINKAIKRDKGVYSQSGFIKKRRYN